MIATYVGTYRYSFKLGFFPPTNPAIRHSFFPPGPRREIVAVKECVRAAVVRVCMFRRANWSLLHHYRKERRAVVAAAGFSVYARAFWCGCLFAGLREERLFWFCCLFAKAQDVSRARVRPPPFFCSLAAAAVTTAVMVGGSLGAVLLSHRPARE